MIVEYEDYKAKLNAMRPEMDTLKGALKLSDVNAEIEKLERESEEDGFWSDIKRSQKVQQQLKQLRNKRDGFTKLEARYDDLLALCDMAMEGKQIIIPCLKL